MQYLVILVMTPDTSDYCR